MVLEPDSILNGWRGWDSPPKSRPDIMRQLGGGRSNRSFLLDATGERMVLRVNAAASPLPGIGREYEASIWRAASSAGIAPPLVHADRDGRFLVSAYIESGLPERPQDDPALAAQALDLLQRAHQLDVYAPAIDYDAHIEAYWRQVEARRPPDIPDLRERRETMRQTLATLMGSKSELALCHHDPVVENFVGTPERLYLVDWEYAARGVAVMDYAALSVEWNLNDDTLNEQADIDPALLEEGKALYRYMCALWDVVRAIG